MYPTHDLPAVESRHSQGPQQAAEETRGERGEKGGVKPSCLMTPNSRKFRGPFRVPWYMKGR